MSREFDDVIALAREIPLNLPSPSRREEVRTAVLASHRLVRLPLPPTRRPRTTLSSASRMGVAIAGVAMAAAAVVLAVVIPRDRAAPAPHVHATITARDGARYTAISTAPDEIVRLEHGTIDVAVAPLHPGERFRVIVGDAEVEVRGTAFTVNTADDRLVSVDVHHGRVEVRPRQRPTTMLGAGEAWRAPQRAVARELLEQVEFELPTPTARPTRIERAISSPPSPPSAPPVIEPPARAAEELAYDEAWTAMRANNFGKAATTFARVMLLAPDSSLAEDAMFWQSVALARGGKRAQAVTAFRDFLDTHPRSPHAGEASAMLGWLLLDSGEKAEAARRFRAAANDPSKAVRDSAQSGLDSL